MAGKIKRALAPLYRTKVRKAATAATLFLIIAVLIFSISASPASAASTVSTSTNASATATSTERHTWYDGTRYWAAFVSDTQNIVFWYSANGSSWTQNTSATITVTGSNTIGTFTVYTESANAYLAYTNNSTTGHTSNLYAVAATSYPGTGFSWGSTGTILGDIVAKSLINYPVLTQSSPGFLTACYNYNAGNAGTFTWECKSNTFANNYSSWNGAGTYISSANGNGFGDFVKLGAGAMSTFMDNTTIYGARYTGDVAVPLAAGSSSGIITNMSTIGDTVNDKAYTSYVDSAGKIKFRKFINDKQSASTKINDAGNPGAINGAGRAVVRTSTGALYSFINTAGTCGIWKSTDNGANWTEQDSAHHPSCVSGMGVAMAVDSTDKLHAVYFASGSLGTYYNTMQSDTWGTAELVDSATGGVELSLDIAIDSSNKPHVAECYTVSTRAKVAYTNRVSGSWSTALVVTSSNDTKDSRPSININNDIPEIAAIVTSATTLTAVVGNQNNATSFTSQNVDTAVSNFTGTYGASIASDPAGNTWIAYMNNFSEVQLVEHISGNAWTTWQTPTDSFSTGQEPSIAVAGNLIYIMFSDSTTIYYQTYNSDTATWGGEVTVQAGSTNADAHARWANYADNTDKPLDYLYSDGTDISYNQIGVWRAPVTLDSNAGNTYTSLSKDLSGKLYAFWQRSNVIYYSTSSAPYTSWTGPTTLYTGGAAVTSVTSSVGQTNCSISVMWTEGAGPTYNINYDNSITANCPPGAPTLSAPSNAGLVTTATPNLVMSATDADSDTVKYKVYLYNTSANSGGLCTGSAVSGSPWDQTLSGTGWNNGTTAYASGASATFTVQTTLASSSSYCWQAQAIDPGGTNTFGSLSTPSTFTVNLPPSAPTLTDPANSVTGQVTKPVFRLNSADPDNDYIRYEIQICTTSNCSSVLTTVCQDSNLPNSCSGSQAGWSSQSLPTSGGTPYTAYSSGQAAVYTYQGTLTVNTQYWWRAYAIDPAGSNTSSSASSIGTFTTVNPASNNQHDRVFQGTVCFGSC